MNTILELSDLSLRFGGLKSLDNVTLRVERGEVAAVIGPNGAGKTSLFNCISGAYRPQSGAITLYSSDRSAGNDLRGLAPSAISHLGVARTFQNIRLFSGMTVLENVEVAVETRHRLGIVGNVFAAPWARSRQRETESRVEALLDAVGLTPVANRLASTLPYGQQRKLEIARALGTSPQLLLLDEPAAGANPSERQELIELIRRINAGPDNGIATPGRLSVLLIEHDIGLVSAVANQVTVLNFGRVIAAGNPDAVRADPAVVEAYLGASDEGQH